jgi:hypothetical protein
VAGQVRVRGWVKRPSKHEFGGKEEAEGKKRNLGPCHQFTTATLTHSRQSKSTSSTSVTFALYFLLEQALARCPLSVDKVLGGPRQAAMTGGHGGREGRRASRGQKMGSECPVRPVQCGRWEISFLRGPSWFCPAQMIWESLCNWLLTTKSLADA